MAIIIQTTFSFIDFYPWLRKLANTLIIILYIVGRMRSKIGEGEKSLVQEIVKKKSLYTVQERKIVELPLIPKRKRV